MRRNMSVLTALLVLRLTGDSIKKPKGEVLHEGTRRV
jgi:hypothetical protein